MLLGGYSNGVQRPRSGLINRPESYVFRINAIIDFRKSLTHCIWPKIPPNSLECLDTLCSLLPLCITSCSGQDSSSMAALGTANMEF